MRPYRVFIEVCAITSCSVRHWLFCVVKMIQKVVRLQIEEYRRRIVDAERQVSNQKTNDDVSFFIKETTDTWVPDVKSDVADYEWASRLDEERRRYWVYALFLSAKVKQRVKVCYVVLHCQEGERGVEVSGSVFCCVFASEILFPILNDSIK